MRERKETEAESQEKTTRALVSWCRSRRGTRGRFLSWCVCFSFSLFNQHSSEFVVPTRVCLAHGAGGRRGCMRGVWLSLPLRTWTRLLPIVVYCKGECVVLSWTGPRMMRAGGQLTKHAVTLPLPRVRGFVVQLFFFLFAVR